ncbi:MAG: enoyl-CoA hydratase/isomerase family protein [Microbacteriaceae bacterium]|nr:MAG: enoyl-CoA hydratase/isomerase family protein [Microbacteriaceae bacterium]
MTFDDILVTTEDRVGTICINRPDKLNAIRQQTFAELAGAIDQLTGDDNVRVIVLTASGAKSFSVGIDLDADGLPNDSISWDAHTAGNAEVIRKLWYADKPVLTAVNGFALAAGCNIALVGDLTIAADSATFGEPEIRHGALSPLLLLPWLTSFKGFNELYLTGDRISADRARELGLVNWVVPPDRLAAETQRIARRIANAPSYALTLAKRAVRLTMDIQGFHSAQSAHRWVDTYLLASHGVTEKENLMNTLSEQGMGAFLAARDTPYGER